MVAVSVCLPVFNGARFLRAAIESVVGQSFVDFELVVCDDCSTDGSFEIASEFAGRDRRVKLVRNEANLGLFQNYNRCIELARGDYLKPFAQDDVLHPEMLAETVRVLDSHQDVALVSTAKQWVSAEGGVLETFRQFPRDTVVPGRDVIRYNLMRLTNWVGEPSTVLYRRAARGTGFDTALFHYGDIEYWFRIVEQANYYYLDRVLCSFRRHEGSATSKNLSGMYFALDVLRLGKKYREYLEEIGETPEHFLKRALEVAALNVDHLVRKEGLNVDGCLSARPSQMPIDEAAAFKELSFDALRYITELLAKISDLEHKMEDQRRNYQAQIADIKASTSWKVTAPLRMISGSASGRGGH